MTAPPIQPTLETPRLRLRPRTREDLPRVAAMNTDPAVMAYIAPIDDPRMGLDGLERRSFTYAARGLGYWSIGRRGRADDLIGYVGLIPDGPDFRQVELSYRFESCHWGQG